MNETNNNEITQDKFQNITNQEILKELAKRLPFFNQDDFMNLVKLTIMNAPNSYKEKLLQLDSQQASDLMKESIQEIEKEKINKQVEEIKKVLGYDKNSEKK